MAEIIAVANQKGGVGKTTTSIEIASALKNEDKKVLLIDMDQQGNLSKYVNANLDTKEIVEKNKSKNVRVIPTIREALLGENEIEEVIQHLDICDVITSSPELSKADKEFADVEDIFLLSDLLNFIKDEYDYIVIDNSPSRNVLLTMAYVAADKIIVPTECDEGSIDGIWAIWSDVKALRNGRMNCSHAVIEGIILTKTEKTVLHSMALDEIKTFANDIAGEQDGREPFSLTVRKGIAASECKSMGQSLQQYDKYGNLATDYRKIAKTIVERGK